jgi:hypothetical protein
MSIFSSIGSETNLRRTCGFPFDRLHIRPDVIVVRNFTKRFSKAVRMWWASCSLAEFVKVIPSTGYLPKHSHARFENCRPILV